MAPGHRAKKRLGQNFIRDANLVAQIVREAGVSPGDSVLEIGPGEGSLTAALLDAGANVLAVELDRDLLPGLRERFKGVSALQLVHGDIMRMDLPQLLKAGGGGTESKWLVVANLPYYITTPILFKLLDEATGLLASITVMVQKEVAERITAPPGGKDYGALTVAVSYRALPRIRMHVPAHAFVPRPKVDSAVITLELRETPPVTVPDEPFLFTVVRAAFAQRRKTIRNTLTFGLEGEVTPEQVTDCLAACGVDPTRRGETMSIEEFGAVATCLWKCRAAGGEHG